MESEYLQSKYIGLHTARYQSAVILRGSLTHPLGSYVYLRDPVSLALQGSMKAHNTCIMVILAIPEHSPNQLVTMSYEGEVKLYSESLEELARTHASSSNIRNGSANIKGDLIACTSIYGLYMGIIDVWRIQDNQLVPVFRVRGNFRGCAFNQNDDLFALRTTVIEDGEPGRFQRHQYIHPEKACEDFASDDDSDLTGNEFLKLDANYNSSTRTHYICLFRNFETELTSTSRFLDYYGRITTFKSNGLGHAVLGAGTREIFVIDMVSLNTIHAFKMAGSGNIGSIDFTGSKLIFSPARNYLCGFEINQEGVFGEISHLETQQCLETAEIKEDWVNNTTGYLGWFGNTLLGLNEYGMYSATFTDFPSCREVQRQEIYKITCCGLAVHPTGNFVAVGDFTGSIHIWNTEVDELVFSHNISFAVRSIAWDIEGKDLYVGSMNASLHLFKEVLIRQNEPILIANVNDSVICIGWRRGVEHNLMATGTSKGELAIFSLSDGFLSKECSFIAHAACKDNEDMRFGSLNLYSEIWTLAWSPSSESIIATGSEDQSVLIWNWKEQQLLHSLPKHDRAVTGVRWSTIQNVQFSGREISEILISCSDDRTLRIYDPKSWEMVHVIDTSFIKEWHTVTYCAIEEEGTRVACVTQNGFMFIFHLDTLEFGFVGRVHNGSVEGLDWRKRTLSACSCDCTVSVVST